MTVTLPYDFWWISFATIFGINRSVGLYLIYCFILVVCTSVFFLKISAQHASPILFILLGDIIGDIDWHSLRQK